VRIARSYVPAAGLLLKTLSGQADSLETPARGWLLSGGSMSAVTKDVIPKKKPGRKKRRKGMAALKALRAAIARRRVEVMQEDAWLQEQLFDVFADERPQRKR
jgi:hypothetical protein